MSSYNVVRFDGQNIIYERVNDGFRATVFGSGEQVGISPELREAIEADKRHQEEKRNRA